MTFLWKLAGFRSKADLPRMKFAGVAGLLKRRHLQPELRCQYAMDACILVSLCLQLLRNTDELIRWHPLSE